MVSVSRREFLLRGTAGAWASYATSVSMDLSAAEASARKRPNILVAISDDQSWVHTGVYGCPGLETPAFDRVAREGALFHNAFCASPMCTVSRSCLLTGHNPWELREAGTHWSFFPRDLPVYPFLLNETGYAIGFTGKGWSPGEWERSGWPYNPAGPEFNDKTCEPPTSEIHDFDYAANFEAFLAQKEPSQPFCFFYGCREPHGPFEGGTGVRLGKNPDEVVLPTFMEDNPGNRNALADYFVELEWFDTHLGRMLNILERRGELENTLVVVTGDNGSPISHSKGNLYEYGVHVPLAVMWPGQIAPRRTVDDLVSFTDLAPTFLEAAGLKPLPEMTGRSLMDILHSDRCGRIDASRTEVFLGQERSGHVRYDNLGYPMRAIRTERYLYIMNLKPDRWPHGDPPGLRRDENGVPTGVVDEESLSQDLRRRPPEELYDIGRDSECLVNLAGDARYGAVQRRLRQRLTETLTREKDPHMLGNGDIWESYPRFGPMRAELGGFAEWGEYNPKYRNPKSAEGKP